MTKILNMTQHAATPEQKAAGVYDPEPTDHAVVRHLLTFADCPDRTTLRLRAEAFTRFADDLAGGDAVMIGGAPYFMPALVAELCRAGIPALFAFSGREFVSFPASGESR